MPLHKDDLKSLHNYWALKVHNRDLCENKWPRDTSEITNKWLSALLESTDVQKFNFIQVESTSTTPVRVVRLKVQHSNVYLQETKQCGIRIQFVCSNTAFRDLWAKSYHYMAVFFRKFAAANPTSLSALSINVTEHFPVNICIVTEDFTKNISLMTFSDWAVKGMNLKFAKLMYTSSAISHGMFFAEKKVELLLHSEDNIGHIGDFVPGSRFSPSFKHILRLFFEPNMQLHHIYEQQPSSGRNIYQKLCPDQELPVPALFSTKGRAIIEKCIHLFSQRPLTLCHGELHPGHALMDIETNEFKWTNWYMVCAAPPGMDLAVGILTALQPCTKAQIRGLVQTYYTTLLSHAPDSIHDCYSFEDCWHDFLIGCLFWCCIFPVLEIQRLTDGCDNIPNHGRSSSASKQMPCLRQNMESIQKRMLHHAKVLNLQHFALSLLPTNDSTNDLEVDSLDLLTSFDMVESPQVMRKVHRKDCQLFAQKRLRAEIPFT